MTFPDINWSPNSRQLRQFAWIALVALPLIGWIWGASAVALAALLAAAGVLVVASYTAPFLVRPVYLGLTIITFPIGMVIGELVTLLIFFTVFLPIAVIFRLMRRDALERRIDRSAPTYWQAKKQAAGAESYFRQW